MTTTERNNMNIPINSKMTINDMNVLIKSGDVNRTNKLGNTALHYAVRNRQINQVRLLLVAGADVNRTNEWCEAPLHVAVENNLPNIAQLLICEGADVNLNLPIYSEKFHNDLPGFVLLYPHTPLELAKKKPNSEVALILQQHIAKQEGEYLKSQIMSPSLAVRKKTRI